MLNKALDVFFNSNLLEMLSLWEHRDDKGTRERNPNLTCKTVNFVSSLFDVYNDNNYNFKFLSFNFIIVYYNA